LIKRILSMDGFILP